MSPVHHGASATHTCFEGGDGSRARSLVSEIKKSRARLASPQPRPTSPVNGAGGITGCRDDAQAPRVVPATANFFSTRLSDRPILEPRGSRRVIRPIAMGRRTMAGRNMLLVSREVLSRGILGAFAVSLTLGAVQLASGRDLSGVSQGLMASSEAGINRAAKSDRSSRVHGSAGQTHTISFRLDGLSDMSVLVRVARSNSPHRH